MKTADLKKASYYTQSLAIEAGSLLREHWTLSTYEVEQKDIKDIVTEYDKSIEKKIHHTLSKEFPDHGFILEEGKDVNSTSDYQWVIDPIDGTKYFGGVVPLFTVSIGLLYRDEPILGTIYNPVSSQLYWSYKGSGGLYHNSKKVNKNNIIKNKRPIISLDLSKLNTIKDEKDLNWHSEKYTSLVKKFYRFRAFGQGSLSLVWLCLGAFDVYLDLTGFTKKVDIIGGLAILKEFGGHYEYIDVKDGRKRLLASLNKKLLDETRELILK
jgi:myo-inositol-1(or 4)-monophosphatase